MVDEALSFFMKFVKFAKMGRAKWRVSLSGGYSL